MTELPGWVTILMVVGILGTVVRVLDPAVVAQRARLTATRQAGAYHMHQKSKVPPKSSLH